MTGHRIYLVTNDAGRAALELWCHPGNLPPSIAVADNLDLMMRIPNGARVRCLWFGTREELEPWENCWWSRRVKGGFQWISEDDWSALMDWVEANRKAPSMRLLYGMEPATAAHEREMQAEAPPAAVIAQTTGTINPRKSKWS